MLLIGSLHFLSELGLVLKALVGQTEASPLHLLAVKCTVEPQESDPVNGGVSSLESIHKSSSLGRD